MTQYRRAPKAEPCDVCRRKKEIRSLRHGELPPEGVEPRRYRTNQGYIRLRWNVAPYTYVDCFEHRWVMGNPPTGTQVHHVNGIKDDNRVENLVLVTQSEHSREHRSIDRAEAVRLYALGFGTPTIARRMGHNHAAVYRAIRSSGVAMRSPKASKAARRRADA